MVLIADPQLVDPHTYPERPWPLSSLTILHTDLYLRRSYRYLENFLRPDTVFFLGDLFDGGREWATPRSTSADTRYKQYGNRFWMKEYARFGKLFLSSWKDGAHGSVPEPRGRRIISSLPGNHDLGFATGIQNSVKDRFDAYFGPLNRVDIVGNHTFISLDTVSLSAMDQADLLTGSSGTGDGTATATANTMIWKPVEEFLSNVNQAKERAVNRELRVLCNLPEQSYIDRTFAGFAPNVSSLESANPAIRANDVSFSAAASSFPTILLTHVPLYRAPDTDCGPLRERGHAIAVAAGYQYQNVLTPLISKDIIGKLGAEEVVQVYSGDDHDYCEVEHNEFTGRIRETTVKSMSWAMGVRRPGFLAVSLNNPVDLGVTREGGNEGEGGRKDTIQDHLCLLPDQLEIFMTYALVLVCTVGTLAIQALLPRFSNNFLSKGSSNQSPGPLLPFSEDPRTLKATSSSSLGPEHTLSARSSSPSKFKLGAYGNLPASSRSSSPSKQAFFDPAKRVPVISTEGEANGEWHMPSTKFRKSVRTRGVFIGFLHSVWQVAWPVLAFYIWVIWTE